MLKEEYNKFARKLKDDLNRRFTRIKWKVDDYDERFEYAAISRKWWAQQIQPGDISEEVFKGVMDSFRINFSIRINETCLMGATEMDGRLITDSSADAISIIGEMVAGEIVNELLIE